MKFQNCSIRGSKVNGRTHTHRQTDRQAKSNMPFQLFQSWGHKKTSCNLGEKYVYVRNPTSISLFPIEFNGKNGVFG